MQPLSGVSAFKPRKVIPIVPYGVKGHYRNIKSLLLIIAYTVYFSMPWVTWNGAQRVGQPILIDLKTLRVNLFDLVIFPHDMPIFVGILILGVLMLFISASLYGRMFCGFFCFQTLWTDAFRWIERLVQGEAPARLRLSKQPWTLGKIVKVSTTHLLWLLLAFATALTFALYFLEAPVLVARIFDGTAPIAAYTTVVVLTATTYVAAGWAREKVCLVACPYGKFQTVMQDSHTLTVNYAHDRGERTQGRAAPSAELKIAAVRAEKGFGDCIDCNYCVNVCPTGVDIRKGFQIDCISCGLCVDACDTIMDSIHLPRGLIRFNRGSTKNTRPLWLNPKAVGYSAALAIMLAFVIHMANARTPFDATVQHYAQPLVIRMANGDLQNRYILRITNKTTEKAHYILHVKGLPEEALSGSTQLLVPAGKTYTQTFNVVLPEETAANTEKFKLILMQAGRQGGEKTFDITYFSGLLRKS